ncbi:MAG TPA: helicase-related protein [Nitrososphaeraceae archaeon]|nr:helicase-related protein [Nitrososphaeraceae archaeon]
MLTPHPHSHPHYDSPSSPALIYNESIEFRGYQKNIADSAYNNNTLVILPTALGKTVIAILVSAHALYNHRRKRVLVIAPTRPLVVQHMKSFFSVLKISQEQLTEVTGKTPPLPRTAIWNNKDIRLIFATPEVVRNDLLDNRLNLNDFSLLIFDEAHRAVKDYAYTTIARKYVDQSEYPMILAMTASPGSDTRRIQDICSNLFIEHLEYRTEEDEDVKPYINPIDINWHWVNLTSEYNYIRSILRSMLDDKLKWLIQREFLRSKRDIRWIFKRDLIDAGAEIRYNLELSPEELRTSLYFALMQQSSALTLLYCIELIESQGPYSLKAFLDRTENESGTFGSPSTRFNIRSSSSSGIGGSSSSSGSKAHRSLLNDPRIKEIRTLLGTLRTEHPKLKRLIAILKEKISGYQSVIQTDNNAIGSNGGNIDAKSHLVQAIVFTQYRDTAQHIVDILNSNEIKASRFVGQAKKDGDTGMKQDEQAQVLESFRSGEFSVLVATSIAEEGLDIPEVDLVIFYEPIPSEIRYIQRRGRTGRRTSGSVIILAAKDTIDERYLNASKRRIEKMNQTLRTTNSVLKPMKRITSSLISDPMTAEEISFVEVSRTKLETTMEKKKIVQTQTQKPGISSSMAAATAAAAAAADSPGSHLHHGVPMLDSDRFYTTQFVRDVNNAARKIHALLIKKGRSGEDVDVIRETLGFDNTTLIEALNKLEKLKRIQWLDDATIILSNNLENVPGEIHNVYIEKILSGTTLVMVDGKWHARLNHYDYDGPRHLIRKGAEFRAVSELYHDGKTFCVRIKQIV